MLKFFRYSKEEMKKKNEFVDFLVPHCKEKNGAMEFNVITLANEMKVHPLDVIRKCKELFKEYYITCETNNDVFPFRFNELPDKETILQEVYEESQRISQNSLSKVPPHL